MTTTAATASKGKKFLKDLGTYAIGNLGSKFITFALVPLYTYIFTDTAEYGYYDICVAVAFFLSPFISLGLQAANLRLLLDTAESDLDRRRAIITFWLKCMARNSLAILAIALIIASFTEIRYVMYTVVFGIIQCFYESSQQTLRGLGKTKAFTTCSIVNSFLIGVFSIVFIVWFRWGIPGLFLANIASRVATMIVLLLKVYRPYIRAGAIRKSISREMLRYSLPIMPNDIIWWLMTYSALFFIQHYLGLAENGIYAVLTKFTGIIYTLSIIFYQTWQQNAIEQYRSPDRDRFFSSVFNSYFYLLCGLLVFFPFGLRINYGWLVGESYRESAQYLFFNSIFVATYAMGSFYELGYLCAKKTSRVLVSASMMVIIGLTSTWLLIQPMKIWGIILANILGYGSMLIFRAFDTRKYMRISFDMRNLRILFLVIVCGMVYMLWDAWWVDLTVLILFAGAYVMLAPAEFKNRILAKFRHHPAPAAKTREEHIEGALIETEETEHTPDA